MVQTLYFVYYLYNEKSTLYFCGKTLDEAKEYIQNQIIESDYFNSEEDFLIKPAQVEGFIEEQTREINKCLSLLWAAQRKLAMGLAAISGDESLITKL